MKRFIIIPLIIGLISIIACGAPETVTPAPEETQPPPTEPAPITEPEPTPEPEKKLEPQTISQWEGTGIKTTEPFTIDYAPWCVVWTHVPEMIDGESMGILQIMVYDIGNPDFPITWAANSMTEEGDTSYIYQVGTFYLTINAANTYWIVAVMAMVE